MPKLWKKYDSIPNESEKNRWAFQKSLEYIKKDPIRLIKLWPHKLKTLYTVDVNHLSRLNFAISKYVEKNYKEEGTFSFHYRFYYQINDFTIMGKVPKCIKIYKWIFLTLFLVSFYILIFPYRNNFLGAPFPLLGIGFILYFTFVYMIFITWPRFSFPILPWMALYIGFGGNILLHYEFQNPSEKA